MTARKASVENRIKKNVVQLIRANVAGLEPSKRDRADELIAKYIGISFLELLKHLKLLVAQAGCDWGDYRTNWRLQTDLVTKGDLLSLHYSNFRVLVCERKMARPKNAIKRDIFEGLEPDIVERRIEAYKAKLALSLKKLLQFARPQIGGYAKCAHLYAKIAYPKNISNELRWNLNNQLKSLGFPRVYYTDGWYFKGLTLIDSDD